MTDEYACTACQRVFRGPESGPCRVTGGPHTLIPFVPFVELVLGLLVDGLGRSEAEAEDLVSRFPGVVVAATPKRFGVERVRAAAAAARELAVRGGLATAGRTLAALYLAPFVSCELAGVRPGDRAVFTEDWTGRRVDAAVVSGDGLRFLVDHHGPLGFAYADGACDRADFTLQAVYRPPAESEHHA